ncbi:MAG: 16S rRNA (guanine(966)-N(2))-methyltransferase RsmD [Vicinamibacterales bacterium]|jgi:16S rRNA (guanine966-N2)-methyltransferase|nr:16S rRNA (guanine(966)-N(2))-methyltransferase RsmD [Vicinamibacterales bacterium]
MRVIGGTLKGRRLFSPRWAGLRPTSDRLRETLFNVLGARVEDTRVLDGCAGTGAVGIEALSRGAEHVVFVEQDPRAVALIRRNVAHCELTDRCTIRRAALPAALGRVPVESFDLVLLDPPYGASDIGAILTAVAMHLRPRGLVVLERARRDPPIVEPALESLRVVRAADSVLELYAPATRSREADGTE